jgi:hypothetical protein
MYDCLYITICSSSQNHTMSPVRLTMFRVHSQSRQSDPKDGSITSFKQILFDTHLTETHNRNTQRRAIDIHYIKRSHTLNYQFQSKRTSKSHLPGSRPVSNCHTMQEGILRDIFWSGIDEDVQSRGEWC